MDFRSWCLHHFPGGTFSGGGDQYTCRNHFRDDKKASLSFCESKRAWHDFGLGEGGKISDFCRVHGLPEWDGGPERREEEKVSPSSNNGIIEARRLWNRAKPAGDHPYLTRKGIDGQGCRVAGDLLLVPGIDHAGNLVGLERIDATGGKKHLGNKSGAFFLCGELSAEKPVYVCEGMATAKSVHAITGCPSLATFGSNNLLAVAQSIRGKAKGIMVCPDADKAGMKAGEVCRAAGYRVVGLPGGSPDGYDWNDIFTTRALEESKALFRERWKLAQAGAKEPSKETLHPVTAKDLRKAIIRQPVWSVEQLVAEGLSVLASPPKTGKSFLVLQMALAVATGKPFLQHRTKQGAVLYAALEDSPSRLSKRISLLVADDRDVPDNLHLLTELPRLDQGGLSVLGNWIADNHPRLVIIDTWAKVKPTGDSRKNAYERDVDIVSEVKKLADRYECSILLVHHEKKGGGKEVDWLESLSGSMGLTATVDGILSLKRNRGERQGILRRSGRDLEDDSDIGLLWKEPGWEYQGDAVRILISEERMRILQSIREAGEPVTPSYVAADIEKNSSTTRGLLMKMVRDGTLSRTPSGKYTLPQEKRTEGKDDDVNAVNSVNSVNSINTVNSVNAVNSINRRSVYGPEGGVNSTVNAINASNTNGLDDSVYGVYGVYGEGQNSVTLSCESVSSLAERAEVPMEAVQEELKRWETAGRVSIGEDGSISLLAGSSFPGQGGLDEEPVDVPSLEWLEGQPEEVKEKYAAELKRVTIIGAVEDPQARALELTWEFAESLFRP